MIGSFWKTKPKLFFSRWKIIRKIILWVPPTKITTVISFKKLVLATVYLRKICVMRIFGARELVRKAATEYFFKNLNDNIDPF